MPSSKSVQITTFNIGIKKQSKASCRAVRHAASSQMVLGIILPVELKFHAYSNLNSQKNVPLKVNAKTGSLQREAVLTKYYSSPGRLQ